jgi:hypothetical protein
VLWQVEAAAFALSLAIVIFAFQAIYATRLRGSLRQFAEETYLFPIFYVGAASLGLDALVLLGAGSGAPRGWAATWAALWGAINLILLALLFVLTLRAVEPAAVRRGRIERGRREARAAAEEVIVERVAARILQSECNRVGLVYSPLFPPKPSPGDVVVRPRRAGRVMDITLRPLRRVAKTAARFHASQPRLTAELGSAVDDSSTLMRVDPVALHIPATHLSRAFRIGRVLRASLPESIEQLHEEALEAIAAGSPKRYRDVADAYREMLLGAEEAWAPFRT